MNDWTSTTTRTGSMNEESEKEQSIRAQLFASPRKGSSNKEISSSGSLSPLALSSNSVTLGSSDSLASSRAGSLASSRAEITNSNEVLLCSPCLQLQWPKLRLITGFQPPHKGCQQRVCLTTIETRMHNGNNSFSSKISTRNLLITVLYMWRYFWHWFSNVLIASRSTSFSFYGWP